MTLTAADVWRDYNTSNVPGSGVHQPEKRDIRTWGATLEAFLAGTQAGGGAVFQTRAEANGKLAYNANQIAWIVNDATAANNGIYQKQGASGSGSWSRVADLPYSFYRAVNSGAGTANAIVANGVGAPRASDSALISFNITAPNTSQTVTVALDGGTPLTIKTAAGNGPAIGGLTAGMVVAGFIAPGNEFHLISDQASAAIQAAAEAAQAAAEVARDLAVDAADQAAIEGAGDVPTYPSRTFAAAATIPTARTYLLIMGHDAKGDAPLARYLKLDTAPTPAEAWHFQSADGAWWELSTECVYPELFGAKGDGAITGDVEAGYTVTGTDDADALIAWAAHPCLDKRLMGKIYATSRTVDLPIDTRLTCIPRKSWIAALAGGTWTATDSAIGAVVNCGGSLVALPDLADDAGKAAVSVTFASVPTIFPNDVLLTYNPTDNSWMTDDHLSNSRPMYRDGEMNEVRNADGAIVKLKTRLRCSTDAHYDHTVVKMYRIPMASLHIDGLCIHAPHEQGCMALNISLLTSVTLDRLVARNSDSQTLQPDRCFSVTMNDPEIEALPTGSETEIYGIIISNTQKMVINSPRVEAVWHAISTGGNDRTGCIPARDIDVNDGYLSSEETTATDCHGNSQNVNFTRCIINNAIGFGGDGTKYTDCLVIGGDYVGGLVAMGAEIVGGDHVLERVTFTTQGSPTGLRGVIDVGGNSVVLSSDTRRAGRLIIKDVTLEGGAINAGVPCVKLGTDPSLAVPFDVIVNGLKGPSHLTRVVEYNVYSGATHPNRIEVDRIEGFADGAYLVIMPQGSSASTFFKLMRQTGKQSFTCSSGESIAQSAKQYFKYQYIASPSVVPTLETRAADGSSELIAGINETAPDYVRTAIVRAGAGNFGSTATRTVSWVASIDGPLGLG
ncbi:MAG: hypothetical protein WBB98_15225 [Xanthobacteraceae bacterium]